MPNIGLGGPLVTYGSRAISGNGQYLPSIATSILTQSGGATSDTWGAAALAALTEATQGFLVAPNQDIAVQFIGNAGATDDAVLEEYDPVAAAWIVTMKIGRAHV